MDMDNEKRQKLKDHVLSWLTPVAWEVGLYCMKVKDENSLINKYYDGILQIQKSRSATEDEKGWDLILDSFVESLKIPSEVALKPNHTPMDFEDNIQTIFKSIGLTNGIEDVFKIAKGDNPEGKRLIQEAKARTEVKRVTRTSLSAATSQNGFVQKKVTFPSFTSNAEQNILTLPISKLLGLPKTQCSKDLIIRLSRRFYFVHEILSADFEELKQILSDNGSFPTKSFVELEFFFRSNSIDFLTHFKPSNQEDIIAKTIIIEAVTVAMNQSKKSKDNLI